MSNPLLHLPPLDAIRGFVAVARRMSITVAAEDLCLTQSAVSRQIQSLEEHLGSKLLIRKHRAIALTPAGEQLLKLASPWLDQLAEFSASQRQQLQSRPVTMTSAVSVTGLWILPMLGAFQAAHPNIDVRVSADNRMLDLKKEGLDMAIRYARAADVPAQAIRLFGEKIMPVACPAIAARAFGNPEGLLKEVLLELDERALPWLRWSDWLSATGLLSIKPDAKPKAYLHLNQYDQVIHAALEGHGIALGRAALLQPMLKDGRLVALEDPRLGNSDYAYWLIVESTTPRAEVQVFRDWIIAAAKQADQTAESSVDA
ncbi:LysR family transcriptional regulator [Undibacterium sp. YM2]|uniref:LysR substrate-binding domain-containing protein n=1 Tax=Undibacterium sp. YM2 TaxID=2058625 RepID=UPI001331E78A|nr:LysR substrate-binding domain-containing protein [Undibacterium sp. YM2]BBB68502.1 LysR family transcriptional regulator [Undibacterium sp. YM2]